MSKVANMLNMIKLLSDGKLHSIKEISESLEVSTRMIRQYKLELEQAGIYIISKQGVMGGYRLDNMLNNIDVGLTNKDLKLLEEINLYLVDKDDFAWKNDYYNVLEKLLASYEKNSKKRFNQKIDIINNEVKSKKRKIYIDIMNAIVGKQKVYIEYISVNSGNTKRVIHPSELFNYKNEWYVAAFCEKRNEIRLFRLNSILDYKVLDEKYDDEFSIQKVKNNN